MGKLKELYKEIWNERDHICSNCGFPIRDPIAHVFSHKKSKGAHPELKYEKSNIELLCSSVIRGFDTPGCHELLHTNPEKFRNRSMKRNH